MCFIFLDDIPIQDPQQEGADNLGAISEENNENSSTPEIHARRSLPKMAASFGKKTKEKIAIAVKSSSVTSMKGKYYFFTSTRKTCVRVFLVN